LIDSAFAEPAPAFTSVRINEQGKMDRLVVLPTEVKGRKWNRDTFPYAMKKFAPGQQKESEVTAA